MKRVLILSALLMGCASGPAPQPDPEPTPEPTPTPVTCLAPTGYTATHLGTANDETITIPGSDYGIGSKVYVDGCAGVNTMRIDFGDPSWYKLSVVDNNLTMVDEHASGTKIETKNIQKLRFGTYACFDVKETELSQSVCSGATPTPDPVPGPNPTPLPTPTPAPSPSESTAILQSSGYLPYYAPTSAVSDQGPVVAYPGTVTKYMPTTGERDDLGYLPGWVARAIILGDASRSYHQSIINADAADTFAWHIDDESGGPLSIDRHSDVAIDSRFSSVLVKDPNADSMDTVIDDAHQPQLTYYAYLKTGDNKYLRELQYQANWHMMNLGTKNGTGLLDNSQIRGFAWTVRQVALAAVATRRAEDAGTLPNNFLSSDYFRRKLENNRKYLEEQTILSINPAVQSFRPMFGANVDGQGFWQSDFVLGIVGQIVRLGFVDWKPIFDWGIVGVKTRATGANGWTKATTSGYYLKMRVDNKSPVVLTWSELATINGFDVNATSLLPGDTSYVGYVVGCLALASSMGDSSAMVGYTRLINETSGNIESKWAFDPTLRPIVLSQPHSNGDPQYVSGRVNVVGTRMNRANTTALTAMIATAAGQTVVSDFPKDRATIISIPPYAHVQNHHAGGGFETNVEFVDFGGGNVFDVKNGVWK